MLNASPAAAKISARLVSLSIIYSQHILTLTGYEELDEMCQVCHHEPLDKTLCEPNKTLRMTVKAVLKKKLHDRANQRKKEDVAKAVQSGEATQAQNTRTIDGAATNGERGRQDGAKAGTVDANPSRATPGPKAQEQILSSDDANEIQKDVPEPSIEVWCPFPASTLYLTSRRLLENRAASNQPKLVRQVRKGPKRKTARKVTKTKKLRTVTNSKMDSGRTVA